MSDTPVKYPKDVLDSVLSESGSMPAAHFVIRVQAFLFDWIFLNILSAVLIRLVVPRLFTDAVDESNKWLNDLAEWITLNGFTGNTPMPQWSDSFDSMMSFALIFIFSIFWLYFTISDAFFSGYTFGKLICRLRTINIINMQRPFFLSSLARGGLKALAMFSPLILLVDVAILRFNKRRQMGHDLLCRTAVVDERYLSSIDQIR